MTIADGILDKSALRDLGSLVNEASTTDLLFAGKNAGNTTTTGVANTGIGVNALAAVGSATHNVALGWNAAPNHLTGTGNVWIGSEAGRLSTACIDVVHIGWEAGELQTAGVGDVGVGRRALGKAGYAANNTCVGDSSGWSLAPVPVDAGNLALGFTTGYDNVIMGYVAAELLAQGRENVLIGGGVAKSTTSRAFSVIIGSQAALINTGAGGDGVTAVGHRVVYNITTAADVTAFGKDALFSTTTGIRNTAVGLSAGQSNTTGQFNSYFGWGTGGVATGTNQTALGYQATCTLDNQVVIGNVNVTQTVLRGVQKGTVYTVATLPSASGTGAGAGARAFVSDANATTFASIVAGGGSNGVPVYSDGTNWRIG
ncbi:hypothetical protein [Brevundimonas bacteroides]|uniref:hypothetical protein n=1 Tax=Brevundimonas bacteroides TaxID=74311 RepID=UPI0012EE1E3E|nr:hypothetical protein [Brevundimonas bacteroides]